MTEEVRNEIKYLVDSLIDSDEQKILFYKLLEKVYSLAEEELAEKDRIIAELKLALNEADKKIKQLDNKPY